MNGANYFRDIFATGRGLPFSGQMYTNQKNDNYGNVLLDLLVSLLSRKS